MHKQSKIFEIVYIALILPDIFTCICYWDDKSW